ncbi:MAG: RNA methyltransferase [Candidatus Rifleibacteriota bacterium]
MKKIESRQNPIFKEAYKVISNRKSFPDKFIVEGKKMILEAIKSGAKPEMVFIAEQLPAELAHLESLSIQIKQGLFRKLSTFVSPADAIAIFRVTINKKYETVLSESNLIVILDRIQDPGNLGTIIRTGEALGAGGIFLLKGSCSHLNHKVVRAAMGSSFRLPVFSDLIFTDLARDLKKNDFSLICADMVGTKLPDFTFPRKTALVMGQEGQGIREEIKKVCSIKLAIPMQGQVESLNVATSTAICLYEWARQQK